MIFLKTKSVNTIIIGAGPAGLFAAIHSDCKDVVVLEKNSHPGKKLLISGTGRCNLTHDCKLNDFMGHYGENFRFLKPALHSFTNDDLIRFFNSNGLKTVVDKNAKVFPASQKAEDVLQLLLDVFTAKGIQIHTNSAVLSVKRTVPGFDVSTANSVYSCKKLVLTTGGMSYPSTGSSGDGYQFAKQLGHSIIPPKPSLSPVIISNYYFAEISGVSLTDVSISLYRDNRKLKEHNGHIGFTHKGLSGPGILDFSRYIQSDDVLKVNFANSNPDSFRSEIIKAAENEGKTAIQTWLKKLDIPRSLLLLLLQKADISPDSRIAEIQKLQRNKLVTVFCEYSFVVSRVGGFNMAMATAGGVDLQEVNSKTMESKIVPGLFFAGEVLDIDGDTGGYNLQAAFSTGFLAAKNLIIYGKEP